jgi:hypothetical protein
MATERLADAEAFGKRCFLGWHCRRRYARAYGCSVICVGANYWADQFWGIRNNQQYNGNDRRDGGTRTRDHCH